MQGVDGSQVIDEQPSGTIRFDTGPVKIKLLVAIISPDANHVAFVGDNINQCELFEKTAESGIALTLSHSGLHRNRHMIVCSELETHDWMADQCRTPKVDEEIHSAQFTKIYDLGFPPRLRRLSWFVIKVAQVVNDDLIPVPFRPGGFSKIRL